MGSVKLSELGPVTETEKEMIAKAAQIPYVYDKDAPPMTPEMLLEFQRISERNRESRRKKVLSVRVSESTLQKAQALGDGYTSIIGRILDMVLNDPELLKKCL